MDSTSIFLWLLGAFGFLLAIGAPVFAALGVSSILGMYFIGGS